MVTFKICLCKTGWGRLSDQQSRGHVCRFNGYSRPAQHRSRPCSSALFFLKVTVGTLDGCRILKDSNAFCKFWMNQLIVFIYINGLVFLHYIMQGFIFCTNMGFSDSFLHYYAVLLRALGAPAVWVSCRPPVPADPVVTALLIICGPQLPDSRTEHVRIRSTEQTRGRRQSFFGPLLSVSLLAASIATA